MSEVLAQLEKKGGGGNSDTFEGVIGIRVNWGSPAVNNFMRSSVGVRSGAHVSDEPVYGGSTITQTYDDWSVTSTMNTVTITAINSCKWYVNYNTSPNSANEVDTVISLSAGQTYTVNTPQVTIGALVISRLD